MRVALCVLLLLLSLVTHAAPPASQIQLAWDVPAVPSQLEEAWGLYRKVGTDAYVLLARLDPTLFSHTDPTVRRNQTYCYRITAIRGTDESPPSNEACARAR